VLAVVVTQLAQAQTFTILYSFTDGLDGAHPYAGLTMDRAGNLYGTAEYGGSYQSGYICELNPREPGCGTVFKLSKQGARWIFSPLVDFQGTNGSYPQAGVTIGPYGNLYGITFAGGTFGGACGAFGCGTVFHLRPPSTICRTALCPWTDIVVYPFTGGSDGSQPLSGLIFDQAGNIYGTNVGGPDSCGAVYELSPSGSGWTYTVLYNFACGGEEISPGGLIFDSRGNLYGVTRFGGNDGCIARGCGTIFELTPSGSGWVQTTLHVFEESRDGGWPSAPIMDQAGNLYGASETGGSGNAGTVWELSSSGAFSVLYNFQGIPGGGPAGRLAMDAGGSVYGMTNADDSYYYGNVFKLTPSDGSWIYTDLHDFTGGIDGGTPEGNVTLDRSGNIYGTAPQGGQYGYGIIFEITP
jgi:uncharacterized repeat protein (TIGR03803 family)